MSSSCFSPLFSEPLSSLQYASQQWCLPTNGVTHGVGVAASPSPACYQHRVAGSSLSQDLHCHTFCEAVTGAPCQRLSSRIPVSSPTSSVLVCVGGCVCVCVCVCVWVGVCVCMCVGGCGCVCMCVGGCALVGETVWERLVTCSLL